MTIPEGAGDHRLRNAILDRVGLMRNPYFKSLADRSMSIERFRYPREVLLRRPLFSRPMAALIARMPDPAQHLDILHNIVEEHGEFQPGRFHQNTFRQFLARIGVRDPLGRDVAMGPAVHAFNNVLMAACASDEVLVGICCLGIIEHAFAGISALIGQAVIRAAGSRQPRWCITRCTLNWMCATPRNSSGWLRGSGMIQMRMKIEQGLALGAYAFDQLYRNL